MINSILHIILFVLISSQNRFFCQVELIPNGSFEEYYWCPDYTNGYQINACENWSMPTTGTSDYFNTCSTETNGSSPQLLFSVPENFKGFQNARTGNAYAGYYAALIPSNQNYYEYLSVKLNNTLEKGKSYRLIYYLSLADSNEVYPNPLVYINHTAALFSENLYTSSNDAIIPLEPQFISDTNVFLNDSTDWQQIEGIYQANGNENYLTIGYFCNYEELDYNYLASAQADSGLSVYYYIDDVSLTEINYDIPNVFSPNDDGANDVFNFNNSIVQATELTVINRWGNIVFSSTNNFNWNGKDQNNSPCTEGVYYYLIRTMYNNINGVVTLLR